MLRREAAFFDAKAETIRPPVRIPPAARRAGQNTPAGVMDGGSGRPAPLSRYCAMCRTEGIIVFRGKYGTTGPIWYAGPEGCPLLRKTRRRGIDRRTRIEIYLVVS